MNMKPSVNVLSGTRSTLRLAITTAVAGCALVLGVASAQADGSNGTFVIEGKAGAEEEKDPKKREEQTTIAVPGKGKFNAKFDGDKLVLTTKASSEEQLDMGIRKKHTKDALKLDKHTNIEIKVDKSKLKLPEGGKKESGQALGTLTLGGVSQDVTITYTVKDAGATYEIESASFTFDYTKHSGGQKICVPVIKTPCVWNKIKVSAKGSVKK